MLKRVAGKVLLVVIVLVAGVAIGRYDLLPISALADAVKDFRRVVSDRLKGSDARVQRTLAANHQTTSGAEPPRDIDTSVLPLSMTSIALTNTGVFANGDSAGAGSLANVEGQLMVMDSIGDIFVVRDDALQKMAYGDFPNGVKDLIRNSSEPVALGRTRALYLAYDQPHATLYASLKRFDASIKHVRFNVSAIAIDRGTLEAKGAWRTVFETEGIPDEAGRRGANGGRLIVANDTVYVTIGDFGWGQIPHSTFEFNAQDSKSSFGKIFAISIATGERRVMSIGHRNPQGLVWTTDGRLLSVEQGPEGGDELNAIEEGNNYGWPYRTFGTDYGTYNWPVTPQAGTFTEPLFSWVPSIAVSAVTQIKTLSDRWNGDLLATSLKARSLFRLRLREGRVVFSEPIWIGRRMRDIVEIGDRIVVMTDDPALLVLRADSARLQENSKMAKDVEVESLAKCMACHHFGETNPTHLAPTLTNLIGKPIASDMFARYSDALKAKNGVWDEQTLAAFIKNPGTFAPGSGMPNLNVNDNDLRQMMADLRKRR